MVEWLRIHLQCKRHWFDAWPGKIPRATEELNPCATATEPALWRPHATTTEVCVPRVCTQQERPPQ